MDPSKKKCMVCGKPTDLEGGICEPCQERIRQEALGGQAETRSKADKEFKRHGVVPGQGKGPR